MTDYFPAPRYFDVVKEPIVGVSVSLVDTLLDCKEQITIGDFVSFGHGCMLLTGTHDYTLQGEARQRKFSAKPITIKKGAWIASGAIILGGVTIGENSVVGAGSVVLHDIPDNELWAGSPAVFKKKI